MFKIIHNPRDVYVAKTTSPRCLFASDIRCVSRAVDESLFAKLKGKVSGSEIQQTVKPEIPKDSKVLCRVYLNQLSHVCFFFGLGEWL